MSRKHYQSIANALARTRPTEGVDAGLQWINTRQSIIDALRTENPKFNVEMFRRATEGSGR